MIISDLLHIEEVVYEAPSIVGGQSSTCSNDLPVDVLEDLSPQLRDRLENRGNVVSCRTTKNGTTAQSTSASLDQGNGRLDISFVSSSSS